MAQRFLIHPFCKSLIFWQTVQDQITEKYEVEISPIFNMPNLTGTDMITMFLKMRINIGTKSPDIQKMFYWLYLEGNTGLRYRRNFGIDRWINLIVSLQEKGELRPDLPSRLIMVLLSSQANGLLNFINDLNDSDLRKKCLEESELMLLKTLLPANFRE